MRLVIDIPDSIYNRIVEEDLKGIMSNAIANGTPLPKGHGRLIDADALVYEHTIARSTDDGHNWNELCVTKDQIDDAPTIIEADKGEEE